MQFLKVYSHFICFAFPLIAHDVILKYFASPLGPTYGLKTFGSTKNTRLTSKLEDDIYYFCSLAFPKTNALNFTCVAILIAMFVIRTFRNANPTSLVLG